MSDNPYLKWIRGLRRFLPATWGQLALVLGLLLLFAGASAPWGPKRALYVFDDDVGYPSAASARWNTIDPFYERMGGGDLEQGIVIWQRTTSPFRFLVLLGALLGLWLGFRPRGHKRQGPWHLIVAGSALVMLVTLLIATIYRSEGRGFWTGLLSMARLFAAYAAGFTLTGVGALLVGWARGLAGRTPCELPVRFALAKPSSQAQARGSFSPLLFMVGALGLTSFLFSAYELLLALARPLSPWSILHRVGPWLAVFESFFPAICAVLVLGARGKRRLWRFLGIRDKRFLLAAFLIPVVVAAISVVIPWAAMALYAQVRYGQSFGEVFGSLYLRWDWPMEYYLSLLLMFPMALGEEIGWRGYLQPRLTARFGYWRGVFLVGLVWGAFHIPQDMSETGHAAVALERLAVRLILFCVLSFVMAWLVVRSGSFLPAVLFHGSFNASISFFPSGYYFFSPALAPVVGIVPWVLLAWALHRYWPLKGVPKAVAPA